MVLRVLEGICSAFVLSLPLLLCTVVTVTAIIGYCTRMRKCIPGNWYITEVCTAVGIAERLPPLSAIATYPGDMISGTANCSTVTMTWRGRLPARYSSAPILNFLV